MTTNNPYLDINRLKKDVYSMILDGIKFYNLRICQDYCFGKIQGILEFAGSSGIISCSAQFSIEDYVDRKLKYLDRGGVI